MPTLIRSSLLISGLMLMALSVRHWQAPPDPATCQAVMLYQDEQRHLHQLWGGQDALMFREAPPDFAVYSQADMLLLEDTASREAVIWRMKLGRRDLERWLVGADFLYWSEVSRLYVTDAEGRLLRIDPTTDERHVIGDGLLFPVVLAHSPDGGTLYLTARQTDPVGSVLYALDLQDDTLTALLTTEQWLLQPINQAYDGPNAVGLRFSNPANNISPLGDLLILDTVNATLHHDWLDPTRRVAPLMTAPDGGSWLVRDAESGAIQRLDWQGQVLDTLDMEIDEYFSLVRQDVERGFALFRSAEAVGAVYRYDWDSMTLTTFDDSAVWQLVGGTLTSLGDETFVVTVRHQADSSRFELMRFDARMGSIIPLGIELDWLVQWRPETRDLYYTVGHRLVRYHLPDGSQQAWPINSAGVQLGHRAGVQLDPCYSIYVDNLNRLTNATTPNTLRRLSDGQVLATVQAVGRPEWVTVPPVEHRLSWLAGVGGVVVLVGGWGRRRA